MPFTFSLSLKNLRRKPMRAFLLAMLVALMTLTLYVGAYATLALRQGLTSYQARLGADIVVVPTSAASHGTVDQILLEGIAGNYYMNASRYDKIAAVEGVGQITRQFYLTSAKASCCSARVQIIGFDPEDDFVITPWIGDSRGGSIEDGCVLAGSDIAVPEDGLITFYGQSYRVVGQLDKTGTGLDRAVYVNMDTMRAMAQSAARLLETSPLQGVDIDTASSAVFIRVAEGYDIDSVADTINIKVSKVEATPARSMVSSIAAGLGRVTGIVGGLVAAVWALAAVVLMAAFALVANERKREFAVLRAMGASRALLKCVSACEAALIGLVGAAVGLALGIPAASTLEELMGGSMDLPFLAPGAAAGVGLAVGAAALSALSGIAAALMSAARITRGETALLIREGA